MKFIRVNGRVVPIHKKEGRRAPPQGDSKTKKVLVGAAAGAVLGITRTRYKVTGNVVEKSTTALGYNKAIGKKGAIFGVAMAVLGTSILGSRAKKK